MKRLSIALIALMVLFCGCDDEQNEDPKNWSPLFSVDFGGYLVEGAKGYVVVTDTSNNVISKAEIINSTHVDVLPQDNYEGESINAFFVLQTPQFYHTTAYLHIKRGSSYSFEGKPVYGMKNPIKLQITDVPPFDILTVGTDAGGRTYRNSNLSDTANYGTRFNYMEGGKIYAQVVNNGQGKFGFLPITDDKSTYQVSIEELDQNSIRKDITVPEDNLYGSYYVIGFEATGNVESHYWLFETPLYGQSFSIFYPDYAFTKYISGLSLNTGDKHVSYTRIGNIVETYAGPTFSSNVLSGFPNSFKHAPIGQFDYYNAEFNHPNGEFVHVFAPNYIRSFSIPDFSSYLSLPPRDYTKYKLQSLSLVDVLGHVEDQSYFKLYSAYPNSPAPENEDRVSYQF